MNTRMFLCLRVDLDYVPWDSPDAAEFGHGEPAAVLRLLELSRSTGYPFHFFASERVLRAFPATGEAVLNEGHDLDWFCKHPESEERRHEATRLFAALGHQPEGLAIKGSWPDDATTVVASGLRFISSGPGPTPQGLVHFSVETKAPREAFRAGASLKTWSDSIKSQVRDFASRNRCLTVAVRPQVLAKHDPRLVYIREILDLAEAVGLKIRTLRRALRDNC